MNYHRIVVKLGTNLLTAGSDHLNLETMASLVGQMAKLHKEGLAVVVVTSGAIAAGGHRLRVTEELKHVISRQVLAAVGQSRLMDAYDQLFGWHEIIIAQTLLTRADLIDRIRYLNARNTLTKLLELRVIPIINENDVVAVEEIQETVFGDNDNLSAMVANLVDADILMLLTDTAGLYTADPRRDSSARLIERVDKIDARIESIVGASSSERGTGGMETKIEAAKVATASGVAVVIADGRERDVIARLASGESIGTFFKPVASRLEGRKRWLLSQLSKGEIYVDAGAATALKKQNKSLLPAGIVKVSGEFDRGDVVNIFDSKTGEKIACGISNYSSGDIAVIKGARSDKIEGLLGREYGEEVVHRDNLVAL